MNAGPGGVGSLPSAGAVSRLRAPPHSHFSAVSSLSPGDADNRVIVPAHPSREHLFDRLTTLRTRRINVGVAPRRTPDGARME